MTYLFFHWYTQLLFITANHTSTTQSIQAWRCIQVNLLNFKLSVRMGNKGDSEFSMAGAKRPGLSIFETFPTQPSLDFTGSSPKNRKYSVCSRSLGKNALLMPKVRGEQPDCFKLMRRKTVAQITTCCKSLNAQHAEAWSRWATAVEDYPGLQCRLRRGNCGYSSHRFIRTGLPGS